MPALHPSNSRVGHRRFQARPSGDQGDPCLPGERGELGRKCGRKVSRVCKQSAPSYPGSFLDTECEGRRRL